MAERKGSKRGWLVTVNKPGKNDGPNWRLRYRSPAGEVAYRSSGTENRAAADRLAAEEAARLNGDGWQPQTVLAVYDLHLAALEDEGEVAAGTLQNYRTARKALLPLIESLPVDGLTPEAVALIRSSLRGQDGRKLRPSTASKYIKALAAAWSWGYEHPGQSGVTLPWVAPKQRRRASKAKAQRTIKRPLEVGELVAVLEAARGGHWFGLLFLLADVGSRLSEVLAADVRDLHEDEGGAWLKLQHTKTGLPRDVPLLPDVVELVDPRATGPLFVAPRGKRVDRGTVYQAFHKLLERAGVENSPVVVHGRPSYPLDVHGLRRSFVAHASRAGLSRSVAMVVTGHEPRTVHDRYERNATGDDLHAAVRQIRAWRSAEHQRCSPVPGQSSTLARFDVTGFFRETYGKSHLPGGTDSRRPQSLATQGLRRMPGSPPGSAANPREPRRVRCPTCGQLARPPPGDLAVHGDTHERQLVGDRRCVGLRPAGNTSPANVTHVPRCRQGTSL